MKLKKWLVILTALVLALSLSTFALAAPVYLPENIPLYELDDAAWNAFGEGSYNQVYVYDLQYDSEEHYYYPDVRLPYTTAPVTLPADAPVYSWDEFYEIVDSYSGDPIDMFQRLLVTMRPYIDEEIGETYAEVPVNFASYEDFLRAAQGVPKEYQLPHDPLIPVKMAAVRTAAEEQLAVLKEKLSDVVAVEAYAMSNRYILQVTAAGQTFYQITQGSVQRGFKTFYTRGFQKGTEKIPSWQMIGELDALLAKLGG